MTTSLKSQVIDFLRENRGPGHDPVKIADMLGVNMSEVNDILTNNPDFFWFEHEGTVFRGWHLTHRIR